MAQNSNTIWTWVIIIIVLIIVIALGWWWYASQQGLLTNTVTTTQTQSSQKDITAFSLAGLNPPVDGTIDNNAHAITLTVPKGTDITKLSPTITVSPSAAVSPVSLVIQDFTNPVTYSVMAEDGSTQTYTVTVVIATDSVKISSKTGIGQFLTDAKGMTLYYFLTDVKGSGKSACTGDCITLWPPFYTNNIIVSSPLNATNFSIVTRDDGQQQLAYKGWPVYYYSKDINAGDVNGQGIGKVWYVIKP